MGVNHFPFVLTSDADSNALKKIGRPGNRLLGIKFTNIDYANTADIVVRTDHSEQTLFSRSNSNSNFDVAPRRPVHDNAGAALVYADAGEPVSDYYFIGDEEAIEVVVTGAGAVKSASFDLLVGY